jgi:hypothetical protein
MATIDYLNNSIIEDTNKLCPHCQTINLKSVSNPNNAYIFYICPNPDCLLLAKPYNKQSESTLIINELLNNNS